MLDLSFSSKFCTQQPYAGIQSYNDNRECRYVDYILPKFGHGQLSSKLLLIESLGMWNLQWCSAEHRRNLSMDNYSQQKRSCRLLRNNMH